MKIVVDIVLSCRKLFKPASVASVLALLALGASGCAVNGNALPEISDADQLVTQSVVKKTKPDGIEETDAELIKSTVVAAEGAKDVTPLAWQNPQTGSSGAIVAIDNFMGKHGQKCRGFKTSVANFMGIAYYNGETCQISGEKWVLSWFKATQ
ncbi:MAG: RT0821/Lpp0805 family surface protein [Rhizobiaceae bacterium]